MNEIEAALNELRQSRTAAERADILETCIRNLAEYTETDAIDGDDIAFFLTAATRA